MLAYNPTIDPGLSQPNSVQHLTFPSASHTRKLHDFPSFYFTNSKKRTRDNTRTERLNATATMLIKYVTETSTSCTNAANFAIQQGPNIDWQGDRARHRVRLQGNIGQTLCIWSRRDTEAYTDCLKVSQIKEKVEEKEGIPPVQQRLIHGGKQMYVAFNNAPMSRKHQSLTYYV